MGVKARLPRWIHYNCKMSQHNLVLVLVCLVVGLATLGTCNTAGNRRQLEEGDVSEGIGSFIDRFWGGQCSSEDMCVDYIATCGHNNECRPSWWVWMILAFIVLSFLASCICCICCGICSCLMDCLCCSSCR